MKSLPVIIILAFTSILVSAQYNRDNLTLEPSTSQNKYRYQHLQLFPVRANAAFVSYHENLGNFVTLKEALEKKKVAVTESRRGEVNTLFIENVSRDTIVILSGEVVQGGKQDRMIAQDVMLAPGSGKMDISVFCVEHGRWQPKDQGMSFTGYFTISSNDVRKAGTVKKDQQEVWNKVAETTEKNKANSSTGTLTALRQSSDFSKELKEYTDYFGKLILEEKDIIGVVAVSGDAILGCDMFATHELLGKYFPNLINSYATEAITSGSAVNISYEKVKQYLQSIIDDEGRQEKEVGEKGTMLKDGKKKIHISTF